MASPPWGILGHICGDPKPLSPNAGDDREDFDGSTPERRLFLEAARNGATAMRGTRQRGSAGRIPKNLYDPKELRTDPAHSARAFAWPAPDQ